MMNYKITGPDLQKQNKKFVRKKILTKATISCLVITLSKSKDTNFKAYSSTPSKRINLSVSRDFVPRTLRRFHFSVLTSNPK